MTRRRLAPEARRALLLGAVEVELAERGFAGMRMADVAERAGVTRAVVYDHFDSRMALAGTVLDTAMDDLLRDVSAAVAEASDRCATRSAVLAAGVDAFFRFVQSRPAARRLLFRDPGADDDLSRRYRQQQRRADGGIAALLEPYLRHCPAQTVELAAIQVKHALNGLAAWWWEHPETDRDVLTDNALRLLRPGLLALAHGDPTDDEPGPAGTR